MQPNLYLLKCGGLEMTVTPYGARVLSLLVPDRSGAKSDVIVGYASLQDYLDCPGERFFGAAVGRLANRLEGGSFELEGKRYHTSLNDNGNTLHGGFTGIDRVLWEVTRIAEDSITLSLTDPDGSDGWPGNLKITLTYTLTPEGGFRVEYKARTDAPTLCNLSHHSFFNLTGDASQSILNHLLQIEGSSYTPVDQKLIPTGEIRRVEGTPFDFRTAKPIGRDIEAAGGYDHNWCLDGDGFRRVAILSEPASGRRMEVWTDQCGLQFYSGNFFDGSYAGKGGRVIGHRCALALETQAWPDAIHHPGFPDTVLRPGQTYSHTCIYQFSLL